MRGRSTVMRESFRSTRPNCAFAANVLYRLWPPERDTDTRELIAEGLLERVPRNGRTWYAVNYNKVEGPLPEVCFFSNRQQEIAATVQRVRALLEEEGVLPIDIKILCTNVDGLRRKLAEALRKDLHPLGIRVEVRTSDSFPTDQNVLVLSTVHSFKGHEAEVVLVPGLDLFRPHKPDEPHHSWLYVALTRARSFMSCSCLQSSAHPKGQEIVEVVQSAWEDQEELPAVAPVESPLDELRELQDRLPKDHQEWLQKVSKRFQLQFGPLEDPQKGVLAQPLFWCAENGTKWACFLPPEPAKAVRYRLEDHEIQVLAPGATPWDEKR